MPQAVAPELLIVVVLTLIAAALVVAAGRRRGGPRGSHTAEDPTVPTRRGGALGETRLQAPPVRPPELSQRLSHSRKFLTDRLGEALRRGQDAQIWDDIEAALIQADVGVNTASDLVEELKRAARAHRVADPDDVRALLAKNAISRFDPERDRSLTRSEDGLTVWMIVGVNGTGKTTTIGKLARDLQLRGRRAGLAAADTFRPAADEQLEVWARRSGATVVKHRPGADPGAVAFDAHQHARARRMDVLIVDTAGRLHTKAPLMAELQKIKRVLEKEERVHEVLLVIDATAGQNGLAQAREFTDAVGVTGIVLAKLDGTAKGGIAVAIEETLGIPIKLIGVGEGIDDLEPFEPKAYVDALLS